MKPIYAAALSIVDRTQPNLDGGLLTFVLNNVVRLPGSEQENSSTTEDHTVVSHVITTFARTGYALSITFGLIWTILLGLTGVYICCQGRHKKKHSNGLVYLAEAGGPVSEVDTPPHNSSGWALREKRTQLQSHWLCLAIQFILFIILAVLLSTGVLLGFATSSQLHANIASSPTHEEAVGRLLNSAELEHTDPPRTYLFPRLLRALAQTRAYLSEFVYYTKNHTNPIVDQLIQATEAMQDRMTNEFNTILFDQLGVSDAFELGDALGNSVISLIRHSMTIVEQDTAFKHHFDRFKIELQTWLRLITTYGPKSDDTSCTARCQFLRATFTGNLTVRHDTFMPSFTFAIALKFVTTDRNQTAESVQAQINQGKILAARQLTETKQIMAERINIPKSIRDMVDQQWDAIGSQMSKAIHLVDQMASKLTRSVAPKVSSGSGVALALGCIFWSILLLLTIGVAWLIIHYHCVPNGLRSRERRRVRAVAAFGLFILALCMLLAMIFFLVGGYLSTEACRYLNPSQKKVIVVKHDSPKDAYTKELLFPLDSHINEFVNHHWVIITTLAEKAIPPGGKPMPLPHIRSPIYALSHNCRENMGILGAMDAIRDFDTASLNDPELSDRFIKIGREIMLDSLRAIDVNELFPKETDEQLAMAGRLDDFIVNFEEIRGKLPATYLSIRSTDDESGNYKLYSEEDMWEAWDAYQNEVLRDRLSADQWTKLAAATQQVRIRLANLGSVVNTIDGHLKDLAKAEKVGPTLTQLQTTLFKVKEVMSNKTALIEQANQLFDKHIAAKTPDEAAKLITQFGPQLMAEVGRCRRLHEAFQDVNSAVCEGVVSILNGFWFVYGWVALVGTLITSFGLLLLLHKPPTSSSVKMPKLAASTRRSENNGHRSRSKAPTEITTCDSTTLAELEQLTACEERIGPLHLDDIEEA
ncbi:hypothetical protein P879_00481 [Paragonimus westermani]|uniref:Prominin n=1 Tax=Paragonimus westermani TaxID=34504 RepID=A0A8T0DPP4_9TREM|nr:hypothetical protein P879_00481 [Paragonimus westermani]